MHRGFLVGALFAASALLAPGLAGATTTFSAYDDGAASASAAVNSNAEQALFSAAAGPTDLITFEDAPLGGTNGLSVAPGVTLGADNQAIVDTPVGSPAALFGFNITSGGSQWANLEGGVLTFNFATPITSFGAYLTGVQLDGDSLMVDGSTVVLTPTPNAADGGVAFLGFTDSTPVTQVVINAGYDIIGVDNVQFSSAAAVPEPAAWALMLVGVGALGGALRVARRKADSGALSAA